jgi:sterol desaturase/sphingolipid hydroxylase (fatty acid hydroxylase superfamily)
MEMKNSRILKILLVLLCCPEVVLGFGCSYYGFGGDKSLLNGVDTSDLSRGIPQLIMNIVDFIMGCLVLPALILVILFGGIYIMISQGNPAKINIGRDAILAGIIGIIIIYVAQDFIQYWQSRLFP